MKMADRLKMFKIELRSVLTGMKNGASLRQLHIEYETRMGTPIPFKQLGFRNVVELIQELQDVAYFDQEKGELRVHAVPDESTAHISRMVSKQRVSQCWFGCFNCCSRFLNHATAVCKSQYVEFGLGSSLGWLHALF